jgi:hypothetical protein
VDSPFSCSAFSSFSSSGTSSVFRGKPRHDGLRCSYSPVWYWESWTRFRSPCGSSCGCWKLRGIHKYSCTSFLLSPFSSCPSSSDVLITFLCDCSKTVPGLGIHCYSLYLSVVLAQGYFTHRLWVISQRRARIVCSLVLLLLLVSSGTSHISPASLLAADRLFSQASGATSDLEPSSQPQSSPSLFSASGQ